MNVVERRTRIEGKDQDLMVTATVVLKISIRLSDSQCGHLSSVRKVLLLQVRVSVGFTRPQNFFSRGHRATLPALSKDLGGCYCAN
jgi:hypothetical protein